MSNLINVKEAPKAYSQVRSQSKDVQVGKGKNGSSLEPISLLGNGKEQEIGRSYQKK